MPVKLLPQLRLLNPSVAFTRMKSLPPAFCYHPVPILSRIFPFRLKFQAFRPHSNSQLLVCPLSTRPIRSRPGSRSEFSRSGRDRGEVRVSKSLIEDEAELSDWVSDLKTSSFRGKITNDDDSDYDISRKRGNSGGDRGKSREREGFSMKRRRDDDSDKFTESNRGSSRGRVDSFSRNSRENKRFGSKFAGSDEKKFDPRRKKRGSFDAANGRRGGRDAKGLRAKMAFVKKDDGVSEDNEDERTELMWRLRDLAEEGDADGGDLDDDDGDNEEGDFFKRKPVTSLVSDRPSSPGYSDSCLSESRFDQCAVSSLSLKGIKDAGYEKMTIVQEATLPVILKGKDVLAKAKTGTGKTVAFLLPAIEVVVDSPPINRDQKRRPIFVLVICPTRELASQAAAEADKMLKHHPSIGVQVVIGGQVYGLSIITEQILVATPGRLRDHIENTAGFATRLMGVKVLVLDEANHLLDMGFLKDIEKIIAAVPKHRQTLLFSATVFEEVRQICHIALKRDHEFINTVHEGTEETHAQVRQMHLIAPLDKHFPLLYAILKDHIADNIDYKVLVFCTTAMVTEMVANLLGELSLNVREIHSRKPQSYRTRVPDEFRKSKGLVTSDVGLPADRQQYIHRLGRTGRKGKEGLGILLLAPWEEVFLASIKDLPISKAPVPSVDPDTKKKVERAQSHMEMKNKEAAYQAWLGHYNSSKLVGRDKYRLVELANDFSRSMGLDNPPAIPKLVLGKMGLKNIPGLRSK